MQIVRWIGIGVVTIAVLALLAGQIGLLSGSPPGGPAANLECAQAGSDHRRKPPTV